MIFIITALKLEANAFIDYYQLKKDPLSDIFPIYSNETIKLIISGVGKIQSSMATLYLYTHFKSLAKKPTLLINAGFCGSSTLKYPLGTLLRFNKVTDLDNNRDYYPDVLSNTNIPVEQLNCVSKVVRKNDSSKNGQSFYDMESTGIIEASKKFLNTHQVIILKIISDYLAPDKLEINLLKEYLSSSIELIDKLITLELKLIPKAKNYHPLFEDFSTKVSNNLKLSTTMEIQLKKNLKKIQFKRADISEIISNFENTVTPSKKEGKKIFEKLINQLTEPYV
jgi:nucleoside phosphorylase